VQRSAPLPRLHQVALYPAVDILGGRAVRLLRGDFDQSREYAGDPLAAASAWVEQGARRLHVVDLDGAREGGPVNLEQLRRIAGELAGRTELIQYGGGLRSAEQVEAALAAGADRVVLGTAAFLSPPTLAEVLASWGERIAVGVDVRGEKVATHGWRERLEMSAPEAVERLAESGVATVVYTNVDLDGTLEGIDVEAVRGIAQAAEGTALICSGGIGALGDLERLAALGLSNLEGVIVGKALYERRFGVAEAQAALGDGN
jgi:phosphoribosylformimino-5-aminoimidazole carboxamide ribotide isomerase